MEANFKDGSEQRKLDKQPDNQVLCAMAMSRIGTDNDTAIPDARDRYEMAYTFGTTDVDEEAFPMSPKLIEREQKKCKDIKKLLRKDEKRDKNRRRYVYTKIEDATVLTENKRILVPQSLRDRIVAWYHTYLVHPGSTRLEATLRGTLTWPNMRDDIKRYTCTCRECQLCKQNQ